jgi:hypothetical protein
MDERDYKAMNEELNQPYCLGAVSGSISVQDTYRPHIKQIQSKSNFFSTPIKYKVTENEIIFEKPTPMYNGNTVKPQKMKSGWWSFQIVAENVPMKKFDFDEDSTNECVIIYYR